MDFPATVETKLLKQQHPEVAVFADSWERIRILAEGGEVIRRAVCLTSDQNFLRMAPKELPEAYSVRQKNFSYTNLLSNILGWYGAALFKNKPTISYRANGSLDIPQDVADFASAWEKDCDCSGTEYSEFMKNVASALLLYRRAYVLIDLPTPDPDGDSEYVNLSQQRAAGALTPHLVLYPPANVINWECDQYGNLEWAEIYVRTRDQEFLKEPVYRDVWYYFDRERVAMYEAVVETQVAGTLQVSAPDKQMATLAPGYPRPHAMCAAHRVPIHCMELPEDLWIANRISMPLVNHLNQDNAFDWALFNANVPQLIIEDGPNGEYEAPVVVSAVGYHHLPNGADMRYLEPEGRAYKAAQERIDSIEERIYKAAYLQNQARTNRSTPTAQSGVSKVEDKAPSRDALSGIGDVLRPGQQGIMDDVLMIAGFDGVTADVRGYDFSDRATAEDMAMLEQATVIEVSSASYQRELQKKAVRLVLPDLNPEAYGAIDAEIDANPTPQEAQAAAKEQQRADMLGKFQASMKAAAASGPMVQ